MCCFAEKKAVVTNRVQGAAGVAEVQVGQRVFVGQETEEELQDKRAEQ